MRFLLIILLAFSFFISCKEQEKRSDTSPREEEITETKPVFTNITACILSEIAYCSNPQRKLDTFLPGWKIVWNPVPIGGNYAFVAVNGDMYAIAFRGSLLSFSEDAFNNWVYHDLNVAEQESWPYTQASKVKVSAGSYTAWQNIEKLKDKTNGKSLWTFLSENVTDKNSLNLAGHSLGGNLATVYASYLWWKFNETGKTKSNINVITFAAPAPGNKSFAEDFNNKFPSSVRVENTNDIVPKFPVSNKIEKLGDLFLPAPSASEISIGYKNVNTKLSLVFTLIGKALDLLELKPDFYGYTHTNGDGKLITIPLSGKNSTSNAADWFAEAGYQHGMAQYAAALGAPVIKCE